MKEFEINETVIYRAKQVTIWARVGRMYLCRSGDRGILVHPEELKIDLLPKKDVLSLAVGQRKGRRDCPSQAPLAREG